MLPARLKPALPVTPTPLPDTPPATQPPPRHYPLLPPDLPERGLLAAEAHARPPEPVTAPSRASYVAVRIPYTGRDAELAHIVALCHRFDVPPPAPAATQWANNLGSLRVKWERHGEFSSYTFFKPGLGCTPFDAPAAAALPSGWLAAIPGQTVCAAHAELVPGPRPADATALAGYFGSQVVVGAGVGEGSGAAYTDFLIHADGFAHFVLVDQAMSARQAGRMLQRLFEIEAYRMMALLALPLARSQWPKLLTTERSLADLTAHIARPVAQRADDDETLLHALMALAAEVESALAASQVRFGASRAYHALVNTRIAELREQRIQSLQTIDEFMARRLSPAMATCATVLQRLHDLSERVAQASALLSTRVDIVRQQQNQALLTATAHRAKLQLRLQQTVEGLSLAAIVYYLAGLVGYGAKAFKAAGASVAPDLLVGASIPLLGLCVWWALRRVHHSIAHDEQAGG